MPSSGVWFTGPAGVGAGTGGAASLEQLVFTDGTTTRSVGLGQGAIKALTPLGNGLVLFQRGTNSIYVSDGTTLGTKFLASGTSLTYVRPGVAAFITIGDAPGLGLTDGTGVTVAPGFFQSSTPIGVTVKHAISGGLTAQGDGVVDFLEYFNRIDRISYFAGVSSTSQYLPAAAPGSNGTLFSLTGNLDATSPSGLLIARAQFDALSTNGILPTNFGPTGLFRGFARLDGATAVGGFQPTLDGRSLDTGIGIELHLFTLQGDSLVLDINPGPGNSDPQAMANIGQGRVAFTAQSSTATSLEPWITDGTAAGTIALGDLRPGPLGSDSSGYTALGDGRFVFGANDGVTGRELWISDGTPAGTRLLADLMPGAVGSDPGEFTAFSDGRVAFTATTGQNRTVWATDGTPAGTKPFGGTGASNLAAGNFSASDLAGSGANDVLPGTPLNDTRRGGAGNDRLVYSLGDDTLDGGAGRDVADYATQAWRDWSSAYKAIDGLTMSRPGERDLLIGVESVRFADGRLVFDAEDPVAQVYRLYQAAFGRVADQPGLHFYSAVLPGRTAAAVAAELISSVEFSAVHGTALDNAPFVESLYRSTFSRASDTFGKAGWVNFLQSGGSRADVLLGFSQSFELQTGTALRLSTGLWDVDEGAAQIARLYLAALDRPPDEGGFLAASARATGLQPLASLILGSPEFNLRPAGTDEAFVTRLYNQALDRLPDPEGHAFYAGQLAGGVSRADVLIAISDSPEHQRITEPWVMSADAHGIVFV